MNENERQVLRRQRLAQWIKDSGGARSVCQQRGLSRSVESQISQWCSGGYSFGQRAARTIEKKLGMPVGYLEAQAQQPALDSYGRRSSDGDPLARRRAFILGDVDLMLRRYQTTRDLNRVCGLLDELLDGDYEKTVSPPEPQEPLTTPVPPASAPKRRTQLQK